MRISLKKLITLALVLVVTSLEEVSGKRSVMVLRSRSHTKREETAKKSQDISSGDNDSSSAIDSSSASTSTSVEQSQRRSEKTLRHPPSRRNASSFPPKEHLPAEKGELGIPEQLMKVRHGVYKGQVAVFVDSESVEVSQSNENSSSNVGGGGNHSQNPSKTYPTPPTTAITPASRFHPHLKTANPAPSPHTSAPTTPATKIVKAKIPLITTARKTTTTRRPTVYQPSSPPPPARKAEDAKTFIPSRPVVNNRIPTNTDGSRKSHKDIHILPACLALGKHCRRHNECCTHHCNWRMGMKCDYTAF